MEDSLWYFTNFYHSYLSVSTGFRLAARKVINPVVRSAVTRMINPASGMILSVSDNGPGISPEISGDIFLPFFTTREKGSGVGLSYSRQVMNMHNGTIAFTSEPGFTEFRLVFH